MNLIKISTPNLSATDPCALENILKSGNLVQGKYVAELERALSDYLDIPYVALVSSGTAALHLSLLALELPEGSGVIVPDFTFPATVNAVLLAGLTPVIADVCPERYVLTEASAREALALAEAQGLQVTALMPVHEFGQPVDPEGLLRLAQQEELKVIEDAACALGARYQLGGQWQRVGALGALACFSFHPRKTLTTGEGGAVATHSRALYERVLELRSHGMRRDASGRVSFERAGFNYRMTDIQASIGLPQLPQLDGWLTQRRALAERYHELLADTDCELPPLTEGHSWQTFMVRTPVHIDRDQLIKELRARGVEANIGAQVLSELPYLSPYLRPAQLTHQLGPRSLALPLCESYSERELKVVTSALKEAISALSKA